MMYAIIDSFHTKVDSIKQLGDKYKLREGFSSPKSFSQDIIGQINGKLSNQPPEKSKAFIMLNTLVSHISIQDFIKFSAVGAKNNEGGIKIVSIPELNVEDHLLMWSDLYGIMVLSADPYNQEDPENLDGRHFILFDCLPPFVVGVSIKNGKMNIISEIEDTEINNKKAELIGDFASIIFNEWSKFRKEYNIETVFEFSFLTTNNTPEC